MSRKFNEKSKEIKGVEGLAIAKLWFVICRNHLSIWWKKEFIFFSKIEWWFLIASHIYDRKNSYFRHNICISYIKSITLNLLELMEFINRILVKNKLLQENDAQPILLVWYNKTNYSLTKSQYNIELKFWRKKKARKLY